MSSLEIAYAFVLSLLIMSVLLFISYKVSYKLGIKKALYRTTYILVCVIFAFVSTTFINNQIFKADLRSFNLEITYKDKTFYTIIDYSEEVIAHSDFLNDLYKYFPSLKQLFMDFPELMLAPFTYVLLFVLFMIIFLPLYLYLSYKRKRRILYDRVDNPHKIWAGILGCIQCVFIISVILTPINGINNVYSSAVNGTLDEEYGSLCEENENLKAYSKYCDIIELYDKSVFAYMGRREGLSDYVFNSVTRISYDDGYTNLSKETSSIIKSGIILDQSGLLDNLMNGSSETIPLANVIDNSLSYEDINIIVDTLSNSKYSEDLLDELGELAINTINELLGDVYNFKLDRYYTRDEIINEIKVALGAIKMLSSGRLLESIVKSVEIVNWYIENYPPYKQDQEFGYRMILDIANVFDLDAAEELVQYLFNSKLFDIIIPHVLDVYLRPIGFNFAKIPTNIYDIFYRNIEVAKIAKKYQIPRMFDFLLTINDEELEYCLDFIEYAVKTPETRGVFDLVIGAIFNLVGHYSITEIYEYVGYLKEEMDIVRPTLRLIKCAVYMEEIDINDIKYIYSRKDTSKLAALGIKYMQYNYNRIFALIAG